MAFTNIIFKNAQSTHGLNYIHKYSFSISAKTHYEILGCQP
jgi:hypothetical protein